MPRGQEERDYPFFFIVTTRQQKSRGKRTRQYAPAARGSRGKSMKIYDNQGKSFDRYTVVIEGEVYTMSESALSPGGINMYCGRAEAFGGDWGEPVRFRDLPREVQEAIRQREAWGPKLEVFDDQAVR